MRVVQLTLHGSCLKLIDRLSLQHGRKKERHSFDQHRRSCSARALVGDKEMIRWFGNAARFISSQTCLLHHWYHPSSVRRHSLHYVMHMLVQLYSNLGRCSSGCSLKSKRSSAKHTSQAAWWLIKNRVHCCVTLSIPRYIFLTHDKDKSTAMASISIKQCFLYVQKRCVYSLGSLQSWWHTAKRTLAVNALSNFPADMTGGCLCSALRTTCDESV